MDGYVAKPVRDEELWAAIDALTMGGPSAEQQPPAVAPTSEAPPSEAAFDREAVLARVGGNIALLQSLAQVFNKDCASLTSEIRAALEKHQVADGIRPAHTLKGVVGFFGTAAATRASQELEVLVKQGDESGASAALGDLLTQIDAIQRNLAELAQERETLVRFRPSHTNTAPAQLPKPPAIIHANGIS
jgi:two-component system, sensor histidine kinase and response regulator